VKIFGTISQQDAATIAKRENDLELGSYTPTFYLNSQGGDVDAAMSIGRIVRQIDGFTKVEHDAECFSSCALIYIAGANRIVDWDANTSGQIGLHRPYLASSPQKRDIIKRETPKLMQNLKNYVEEMGLPDTFYRVMVSTEPSSMALYGSKYNGLKDIYRLVPNLDSTYDEIEVSYDARWHGVDTAEMRRRTAAADDSCGGYSDTMKGVDCRQAEEWGLSMAVSQDRWKHVDAQCKVSDAEQATLQSVKRKDRRDHPIYLKREACVRKIMLGQ